jgi:putative addiction module component (TIGR02574 family)
VAVRQWRYAKAGSTIAIIATETPAMGNQLELLEAEALQLTYGERAAFAQVLLASLDEDPEIEDAWAAETERRIADIESGVAQVIPIADALAQVRAALK